MTNTCNTHNLSIGHCNIQGGLLNVSKSNELTQLIRDHKLDLLSLNETNLNDSIHTSTINIPSSFDLIRSDRPNSTRGGCGLMISRKLAYAELKMDSKLTNIEAIWIKLKNCKINICSFYRSEKFCSVDNFIDYMNFCMKKLNGKKVVWIGDINIDQNNISSTQYKKLDKTLKCYNLVQTIQGITRIARKGDNFSQTTIDVVFTNCYSDFIKSSVLKECIGDHQAIMCEINSKVPVAPKFEKIEIRNHSKSNIQCFTAYLRDNCDFSELLNCTDIEVVTTGLYNHMEQAYSNFFPPKTIVRHEKFIHKPSPDLLNAINFTHFLFKKFKKLKKKRDQGNCSECGKCTKCTNCKTAWDTYKVQRNIRTKLSKSCKRSNIIKDLKVKSVKNDLKGIWKTIKLASNITSGIVNDKMPSENNPETFNSHFTSIGSNLQDEAPNISNVSYTDFLPPRNSEFSFHDFQEVEETDILNYVSSLNQSKATFDEMPLNLIKIAVPYLVKPLTHIVNISLRTGSVPSLCKKARVTPVHKFGDRDDPNNYRPISIIPFIGKLIEYFVCEQLTDYMEENRLFTRHQYGFRKNHSTTYLMFDLMDEIYQSKSKSYKPGIIFLDIKKAFDTVNHDILIQKLSYYGIGGTVLKWFKNFLVNRHQCTKINGKISSFLEILSGVPQGSILGPILFSIYINDIAYACNLSKPYLFADDGALFFEQTCRSTFLNMKIELITLFKWLSVNKLSLNSDKTTFLLFDSADLSNEIDVVCNSRSINIKECKENKYLGLILDNKLNFKSHIDYIVKKVSKRIGAMYRSKSLLPTKYRKMFANALMLPQFDYLDTIYCRASKTKLAELDLIYKKVAKIALDTPQTESSLNVYKEMKWLPLHLRRQLHLSNYMFRIIHDNCPTNFMNKFNYVSGGSRNSESCNLYVNRSSSHKNFQYLGAKCWNNLSSDMRNLTDVDSFNKSYKKLLLDSIQSDTNYIVDNSFDKFYSAISTTTG